MQCNIDSCSKYLTDGINVYLYESHSINSVCVLCVFVCVCVISNQVLVKNCICQGGGRVILREAGGAKCSEGARFSRATKFFCKRVISVATLL